MNNISLLMPRETEYLWTCITTLESSGTKVFMNGPIVRKLCEGETKKQTKILKSKEANKDP